MPYYKTKLDKTLESDKLTDEEKRNLISNRDKDSDKNIDTKKANEIK